MQLDALFTPLQGHVHVLSPSPAGYDTPGVQRPSGMLVGGGAGQLSCVHLDSFFKPFPGQVQVLQPSAAVYDKPGQHRLSGIGGGAAGHVI